MEHIKHLNMDMEYQNLKLPLSDTALKQLESDVRSFGCRKPIIVWNDTIIDGYKRYAICKRFRIPFQITKQDFLCREEALSYICTCELMRNDLTREAITYLIGKQFEEEKCINAKLDSFYNSTSDSTTTNIHKKITSTSSFQTAILIGQKYSLAYNTVYKYGAYARSLDNIRDKVPEIAEHILTGSIKISHENIPFLAKLTQPELLNLYERLTLTGSDHICYSNTRHELQWKHFKASTKEKKNLQPEILIKKLPEYDPDAEIASLTLTIPSWVSTIERTKKCDSFPDTSKLARNRLLNQLLSLRSAANTLIHDLQEEN